MRNAPTRDGLDLGDSLRRMLSAKPLRNTEAIVRPDGPEGLQITVKLERSLFPPPLCWVVPSPKTRTVRLDRLGAQVWNLCDGRRTVEAVVEEFARTHGLTFHEARVAVTEYLRQLLRRGALAIAM
ncbi:MAG TPA: PqqD family protein [Sumerlaeia bacterium]|nr:PqqD family protein [Sumerlaeia bacterium]